MKKLLHLRRRSLIVVAVLAAVALHVAASESQSNQRITATVYLQSTELEPGAVLKFWVAVQNDTGREITNLTFESFSSRELKPEGSCWSDEPRVPDCIVRRRKQVKVSTLTLAPGGGVTFTALLRAPDRVTLLSEVGVIGWSEAGQHREVPVLIGPLRTKRPIDLGNLITPVLVALGTGLIALYLRGFEQRKAELQQTWSQLLTKTHEYAERYYMPISTAIVRVATTHEKSTEGLVSLGKSIELRNLAAELLRLLRRVAFLHTNVSGWYFKDLLAETLARDCWRFFLRGAFRHVEKAELTAVVSLLDPADEVHEVWRKLRRRSGLMSFWRRRHGQSDLCVEATTFVEAVEEWSRSDLERYVDVLRLLELVLDYEINRPYEKWYGQREEFDIERLDESLGRLDAWQAELMAKVRSSASTAAPSRTGETATREKSASQVTAGEAPGEETARDAAAAATVGEETTVEERLTEETAEEKTRRQNLADLLQLTRRYRTSVLRTEGWLARIKRRLRRDSPARGR